jgi:ABC-type Fe3+/spermidine/putrescine transport system ATPase subunit
MIPKPLLRVTHLYKSFGSTVALEDVSLDVGQGEIVCMLGPSGCGKTTLLRLIAGLETADRGHIFIAGRDTGGIPVHERGLGFMFQEHALFPHQNVGQNIAFGLKMADLDHQAVHNRVAEVLELVGLTGMSDRSVDSLSGGEQQRVALARSLAPNPRLLLLDEPLGSLDRALRQRLMSELRHILKKIGVTAITVTHDQQEAFALADKIVVMDAGRALQTATPEIVYRRPNSPTVARFLGLVNLLPGTIIQTVPLVVQTEVGSFPIPGTCPASSPVTLLIRPEAASLGPNSSSIQLEGTLTSRSFRGGHYQIEVACPAGPSLTFALRAAPSELPAVGESIQLHLDPGAIGVLPTERVR